MSGALRSLALAALACLAAAAGAGAATPAEQLYPVDLRANAGQAEWYAGSEFRLDWDRPPIASQGFPVAAVHFQVRNAAGALVVPTTRLAWDRPKIERIQLPRLPGVYTADVWLEGPGGQLGPPRSAALRFDDVAPGSVRPLVPAGWVAASTMAQIRIERPAAPLPISGIRGYAISVDRDGVSPCAQPTRCTLAETDLDGGIGDDIASLGLLAEGAHVVRAVAVSGSGVASAATDAVIRVDATRPSVELSGAPRGWTDGPVRLTARATDALSGMEADGPGGPATAIAVDGAVPKSEPGAATAATVSGEGVHEIAAFARDAAGNSGEGAPAAATVSIDASPPTVAFARAQDPADPERIEAAVGDSLSGPSPTRGTVAVRLSGSRQRWQPLPTAALPGRLVARWDSDSFPPGSYEFRATGYDLAGNAAGSERRVGGARMVLRSPLKAPTRIVAGLDRRRAGERPVRHGQSVRFGGRLSLASGAPLAGMPVSVIETFDPGSDSAQRVTVVETAADGSFRTSLGPGPSRRVEAVFTGSRVLGRSAGGLERLAVAAGIRLRASARTARVGGPPVLFRGRVASHGADLPAGGLPVELQFRLAGERWLEFRTVQTDARGRFRYAYAFSDDDSRGVRFQFRAYIRGGDRPYEPAASDALTVTGR